MVDCEIGIIGAGPYGLAAAAHLRSFDTTVFGRTMSFWRDHMPAGMRLRSPREASNISAPDRGLSLEDFEREHGLVPEQPLPLERFVDYGAWFQDRTGSTVDGRTVQVVERKNAHFRVQLDDGETRSCQAIVVAAGIREFAWQPSEFTSLPEDRVSHSVEHADLSRFRAKKVIVVGGGQSAVESAALLHECGATVELLVRASRINWLTRSSALHKAKALRRLLYAPADIGPAGVSWLVALPGAFRLVPRRFQEPLAERSIRPAASAWLVPRVRDVAVNLGRPVSRVTMNGGHIELTLVDGEVRTADHVLLATGYRVDIARYPFLSPGLVAQIDRVRGYPRLSRAFETSVPGLFVLGAPAAWSFGPLFRFVAGTGYAATALARSFRSRPRSIRVRRIGEAVARGESTV
jgi:cation diffusion facilitator CzcD-associated flavoprotein CzcO